MLPPPARFARFGRSYGRPFGRLRAVERRWIPEYETALAALELSLDESEREQGTRVRWVLRRSGKA